MPLTASEKIAGRDFRDRCWKWLEARNAMPGLAVCSPYITWYRHECAGKLGTQSLRLREHYWSSPLMAVTKPPQDPSAAEFITPGLFIFIWREGHCGTCDLTVRSGRGRFALRITELGKLEKGAVSHGTYQDLDVPQGQGNPAQPS